MKFNFIIIIFILIISCNQKSENTNKELIYNHNTEFKNLIDAYIFLADNHDLLHIMMGEYDGSPEQSYLEYKSNILSLLIKLLNLLINLYYLMYCFR